MLARVDAADFDRARVGLAQTDDALERCRLAGAIGTDQAEDLAILDVEADAARRFDAVVPFLQIANDDFRRHGGAYPLTAVSAFRWLKTFAAFTRVPAADQMPPLNCMSRSFG